MLIFRTSSELKGFIDTQKNLNKRIGFVPTMGALHAGHISLINCSMQNNALTIASIFVNPTQFNSREDLNNYPRKEMEDVEMLKNAGCNVVFIPETKEMYPEEETEVFDLGGLDLSMEGKFRKGHFNGVAQIVSKLFKIVTPDNVYFGRKDFQQLVIVKYLNNKYLSSLKINVVSCDTIREPDGLAMSSRNLLLTLEQRKSASNISKYLFFIKENYSAYTIEELKIKFIEAIQNDEILKPEYIEIVDNDSLKPVETIIPSKTTLCVAVYCGKIRLIDNISF